MKTHTPSPTLVRNELSTIVGERYVSADAGVLASYSWKSAIGMVPSGREKFEKAWPIAVVLPGDTQEVAAIVKCCIDHGLKFKAHSTGYGSMSNVVRADTVAIDLRRMDFLEIDEANRMAVIGPYVTANRLQAEAFKRGLTCHIVGAGPAHSPLASATSMIGIGITSHLTSMNVRNLLSWEWVTPTGEIIRGGSEGSGAGWFSSDGPGPGVRGMIRGFAGGMGGMGVFTRIGLKLYPIPFKGTAVNTGKYPQIGMQLPDHTGFYQVAWATPEDNRKATFEVLEADIALVMLRMPPDHIGWTITSSNAEYVEQVKNCTLPEVARVENRFGWSIVLSSRSPEEAAWRDRILRDIVERTGGRFLRLQKDHEEVLFRNLMTSHYVPRVFRPTGGIATTFGVVDSFHFLPGAINAAEELISKESASEKGRLVRGSPEEHWIWPHEGKYMWAENIIAFDPENDQAKVAAMNALLNHFAVYLRRPVGSLPFALGPAMDLMSGAIGKPQNIIRSVKRKLDPDNVSHSGAYVDADMPQFVVDLIPKLRPLVLSSIVREILSRSVASGGISNIIKF
jgi:glycolate oxidase